MGSTFTRVRSGDTRYPSGAPGKKRCSGCTGQTSRQTGGRDRYSEHNGKITREGQNKVNRPSSLLFFGVSSTTTISNNNNNTAAAPPRSSSGGSGRQQGDPINIIKPFNSRTHREMLLSQFQGDGEGGAGWERCPAASLPPPPPPPLGHCYFKWFCHGSTIVYFAVH